MMDAYTLPSISAAAFLRDRPAPGWTVYDVRRAAAVAASAQGVSGAVWRDPEALHLDDFGPGSRSIFFCAHGREISAYATAMALVSGGDALMIRGGFAALVAAGARTEAVR